PPNTIRPPNRNLLLGRAPTADGPKTGPTAQAGYCLVASAERNGQRLITAVFGTSGEEARSAETQKLLTYGFRFFETRTLYEKDQALSRARVWKGAQSEVDAGLRENLTLTVPRGRSQQLQA